MKIGAKVKLFNFEMRNARAALGISQLDLAERVGCNIQQIGLIEGLQSINGHPFKVLSILKSISDVLCVDYDVIFPEKYVRLLLTRELHFDSQTFVKEVDPQKILAWQNELLLGDGKEMTIEDVEEEVDFQKIKEAMIASLDRLSPMEKEIIELRFGLNPESMIYTLEEVGKRLGRTKEAIRQVEHKALNKLRHPTSKICQLKHAEINRERSEKKAESKKEEVKNPEPTRAYEYPDLKRQIDNLISQFYIKELSYPTSISMPIQIRKDFIKICKYEIARTDKYTVYYKRILVAPHYGNAWEHQVILRGDSGQKMAKWLNRNKTEIVELVEEYV